MCAVLCTRVMDTHAPDNRKIKQQSVLLIFVLKHFQTHKRQPTERDGKVLHFLLEHCNQTTWNTEKEAREEEGGSEGGSERASERVCMCVFLAGSLKCSNLLLPYILRCHGYRLEGHSQALSAPLTLC